MIQNSKTIYTSHPNSAANYTHCKPLQHSRGVYSLITLDPVIHFILDPPPYFDSGVNQVPQYVPENY